MEAGCLENTDFDWNHLKSNFIKFRIKLAEKEKNFEYLKIYIFYHILFNEFMTFISSLSKGCGLRKCYIQAKRLFVDILD